MYKIYISDKCEIKTIGMEDIDITYELCKRCSDYYMLHCGVEASEEDVEKIFKDLPPGKNYMDKFVFGIFKNHDKLIGIIDIVKDFPVCGQWMLGLMLIDLVEREKGFGKIVHRRLTEWAGNFGAESFRIGVIDDNIRGLRFWESLGYRKIGETRIELKNRINRLYVMTLNL